MLSNSIYKIIVVCDFKIPPAPRFILGKGESMKIENNSSASGAARRLAKTKIEKTKNFLSIFFFF